MTEAREALSGSLRRTLTALAWGPTVSFVLGDWGFTSWVTDWRWWFLGIAGFFIYEIGRSDDREEFAHAYTVTVTPMVGEPDDFTFRLEGWARDTADEEVRP